MRCSDRCGTSSSTTHISNFHYNFHGSTLNLPTTASVALSSITSHTTQLHDDLPATRNTFACTLLAMTGMPMSRARSCVYSVCLSAVFLSLLAPCHSSGTSNQPLYLSTVQSQLLLDLHNSLRSAVTPPSANMQGLYWDNDLATAAATLAATCPTATSASSTTASTNIAYIPPFAADGTQGTIAQLPISNAVTAWTAPAVYYNFNANTCGSTGGCLSWLNLIYAPSYTVGCGLSSQQCSSVPVTYANGSELISSGYSIVCMYAKGGASTASQPYVAGLSCGGCPANFASCSSPSTCVSSGGTCPALCAVQGGLGNKLPASLATLRVCNVAPDARVLTTDACMYALRSVCCSQSLSLSRAACCRIR